MISLRISEEEYAALRHQYSIYGARNVSDLARLALQRVVGHPPAQDADVLAKVQELNQRVSAVEGHLASLLARGNAVS
jgi:hypothetical protein